MKRLIATALAAFVCASTGCGEVDTLDPPPHQEAGGAQDEGCTFIAGDLHIESQDDLARIGAESCVDVGGTLYVVETALADLDGLEAVRSVGQFLTIYDNPNLRDVSGLSSLRSVGSQLLVSRNPQLAEVRWRSLEEVGSTIRIFRNFQSPFDDSGIRRISLPSLSNVDGGVRIVGEWQLESLALPALEQVDLSVHLEHLPALEELDLSSLREVGWDFVFQYNRTTIDALHLPSLERVGQDFLVRYNGDLETLTAPELDEVSGDLVIAYNRSLPDCEAEALADSDAAVGGERRVYENDYMALCSQDTCTIHGDLVVETDADIAQFAQTGCSRVDGDVRLVGTELRDLRGLENLRVVEGEFFVRDNPRLVSLRGLDNLHVAVRLWVEDNPQVDDLSGLDELEATHLLVVRRNERLTSLDGLERLEMAGRIIIEQNPALVSIEALRGVPETHKLVIRNNPSLPSLAGLERLETVVGNGDIDEGVVIIESNESLASIAALSALVEIRAELRVVDNPLVPSCEVDAILDRLRYRPTTVVAGNDDAASCP